MRKTSNWLLLLETISRMHRAGVLRSDQVLIVTAPYCAAEIWEGILGLRHNAPTCVPFDFIVEIDAELSPNQAMVYDAAQLTLRKGSDRCLE